MTSPARKRRKEARPGELIEAGLAEFAARGFAGARLEDVASRAGVVKGTIYRYFPTKEALFLAVVRSRITPIVGEIRETVDRFPGSTRSLLELIIRTFHARQIEGGLPSLMRIIIAEGENFPALTRLYYEETVSKGRALLEQVIARGLERGEVRSGAAAELPIMVMAPAVMATIWGLTFQKHAPIEPGQFLAAHIDLVVHGLLSDEAPEK